MRERTRHFQTVVAAFMVAVAATAVLLWASETASGQSQGVERQAVAQSPEGAPYVAGEILVSFEPGRAEAAEEAIQRSRGEVEDRLPDVDALKIQLPDSANERALEAVRKGLESSPAVESADYNYVRELSYVPSDRFFKQQYGLRKVHYPGAWNKTRGGNIRIGIVDSGVQAWHPDIRGKVVEQRDFVDGDGRAEDNVSHGTHTSGIAAARTDNRRGVAGACPGCNILAAKIADSYSGPTDARIAKGINWSTNNGADVINLSLGGPQRSAVIRRAVNRAWNRGVVIVAAAGNDGTYERQYPAAYKRVMAVSATDRYDRKARFSQRGKWLSVAAPGVDILSTIPGGYDRYSGTSMSSPSVAGLAGLMARQGRSNQQIRSRIQRTAVDLGPEGKDVNYGHGRINARRAVLR